jgi:glycosyltransferase involved in cell wall biosynthesis
MRLLSRLLWLVVDVIVAIPLVVAAVAAGLAGYLRYRPPACGALLHLSGGASTTQILRKYGTFAKLFDTETPPTDRFTANVLFWFPSDSSHALSFPNGWTVLEQGKIFGRLILSAVPLYIIRALLAVRRHRIVAIRAWDPGFSGPWGVLLSRLVHVPLAVSIHADYDKMAEISGARGTQAPFGSRAFARRVEGFVLKRANLVMPIRNHLAQKAQRAGVNPTRLSIIPHGVDLREVQTAAGGDALRTLDGRQVLSFAGRLSPENYVDDILQLARRLGDRTNVCIAMAGHGPEEARLKAMQAADPVLQRNLVFLGALSQQDVFALRRQSVLSLCLMGGFSLIEACAAGRPVVAYDVDWHSEIVIDDQTGYLIREGDIDTLFTMVTRILDNPDLADRLGHGAHALAVQRHSLEAASAAKRTAYARLLEMAA